ncbi:MAG: YoaK family protein [Bacillota bacterium]|nr:YoaK family protein [Bacillota bacterium]
MFRKKSVIDVIEKLGFAMMLTAVGGFMDAYSYVVRGKVFATGQTGNFVLVCVHMMQKDYIQMFHAIVPIVSFWIGVFISCHMLYYFRERQLLLKHMTLVIEILLVFIVGLIPCSYPDIIANTLISFAASLQYCAFRKFSTNGNYANIFCTGNMRSCAENYYKGVVRKDKQSMKRALGYTCILISFFIGAASAAYESKIFHAKSIWSLDIVLIGILLFL